MLVEGFCLQVTCDLDFSLEILKGLSAQKKSRAFFAVLLTFVFKIWQYAFNRQAIKAPLLFRASQQGSYPGHPA